MLRTEAILRQISQLQQIEQLEQIVNRKQLQQIEQLTVQLPRRLDLSENLPETCNRRRTRCATPQSLPKPKAKTQNEEEESC